MERSIYLMKDDYGYFGTGTTGYAHYMQAFERSFGKSGNVADQTEDDEWENDALEDDETEEDDTDL
jgi:hypothetical protein